MVEVEIKIEVDYDLSCCLSSGTEAPTNAQSRITANEWKVAAARGHCKKCMVGVVDKL